nr:hypothetical protein [uncultured Eisenbergiella sp.]
MESMIREKVCLKWNEIFYYLFLLIMTIAKGSGLYEGMRLYNICLLLAGICIFIKIVSEKYNILEFVLTGGAILISFLVYRNTGDQAALIYTAMIIGMKNIPIKRVFLLEGCVWCALFLCRSFLGMSGIYRGMALVHEKLGLGPMIRWSFGYPHPNVLQITYAVLVAFILYNLNYKGKKLFKLLFMLFIGNCVVFLYSVSYTGFILTIGLLGVFLYFSIREKRSKLENVFIQCILPASVLFAIGLPLAMEKGMPLRGLDLYMNKLFNTRFLASRVFLYEGVKLFGTDVSQIGFALDCSYVYLLMKGGLVLFIFLLLGYFFLIRRYIRLDKRRELAIITTFLFAGISEPFLFNTSFKNITFFFLGEFLFEILTEKQREISGIYRQRIGLVSSDSNACNISVIPLINLGLYIKRIWKRRKKFFCVAGAIITMAVYTFFQPFPHSIYVAVGNTDCGVREEFYLPGSSLENTDYRIYEYQGEQKPMYQFTGKTVEIEIFRDEISCIILGGIAGIFILFIILSFKYSWKNEGSNQ